MHTDVVIVGAGLAGLCCARRLHQCGIDFQLLEASDGIGGRVRTDFVDGFQLDRGFQVYLPAYPEGKRILDLPALNLRPFRRGALIRFDGKFHRMADPRESPIAAVRNLLNPIGTFRDKFRLARYSLRTIAMPLDKLRTGREALTLDELRWTGGFSPAMIDRFLRPWLGGVFLERNLSTSSRFFRYVYRMFAEGGAALPAAGMGAIPQQIANLFPSQTIRKNAAVRSIVNGELQLATGERMTARAVVVATDATTARQLLGEEVPAVEWCGSTTLYYVATESPVGEPTLVLNGEGQGVVNSVAVLSDVAPTYAPPGQVLISVGVIGVPEFDEAELDRLVRTQLQTWYGSRVDSWKRLRVDRIRQALPEQTAGWLDSWQRPVRLRPGLYVCGDHRDQASIDGAITSGFRTAQAIAEDLYDQRT